MATQRLQTASKGSGHSIFSPKKQRPLKRPSVLWLAVRKSIPAFVPRPIRQRFNRQRAPRFMIDPDRRSKVTWDILITCCVLYTTCVVPYRVCFKRDAKGGFATFETTLDVFFVIDIVLNFLTGVHLPSGEICYESAVVAQSYLRGWFFIDFFSTIPFDNLSSWFGVSTSSSKASTALASAKLLRSLKILRLFKLARIRKLSKMFSSLEEAVYTNQSLLSLCKLAFFMLFLSHLVACLWFVIGNRAPETARDRSWVYDYDFEGDDDELLQYLVSVYWAIVTMATIGYGDIVSRNNSERVFNIVIMAIGVSFFGYVIGTITTLVSNLDVAAALYDERLTTVKEYIISRCIPKHLSKRIRDHFEYYYQNRSVFKEKIILSRLPSAMRNDMIHHVHTKIVGNVKYFSECHESLISDIVMNMKPFSVLKDEYVYVQHEIAAHVFFLLKGKIYLTKTTTSISKFKGKTSTELRLATLTTGEHFGELEVYDHEHGNGVRICSAIAKSYCELTFLSRQAISKIGASWPEVLRHFKDAAKQTSKKMRRRVDKPGSVDALDREDVGECDDDATDSDDRLFRDEEMETHMIKSTLLAHKTMRASVKTPLSKGRQRVLPFMNRDDDAREVIAHSDHSLRERRPPVEEEESSRQGSGSTATAPSPAAPPSINTSLHRRASAHLANSFLTAGEGNPSEPPSPLASPASTPLMHMSSMQSIRGRVVLQAISSEKVKKVSVTRTTDDSLSGQFHDVGSASHYVSTTPEQPTVEVVTHDASQVSENQHDTEVDSDASTTSSAPGSPSRVSRVVRPAGESEKASIIAEENGASEGDEGDAGGTKPVDTTEHARTSVAFSNVLARLQPSAAAYHVPADAPPNGQATSTPSWKNAAAAVVATKKRDQESRRNLNDIIAKIRESPGARSTPNFHAEQVMLKGTYVFHPQERFILTWQFIVGLGILYSIIVVPYRLGFDVEPLGGWAILEVIIDCFFGVDICLNFRTAFFDTERLLIFDTRIIFWRYVKGWFIVDFLSTIPIDDMAKIFVGAGSQQKLRKFPTKLLRLFRVARLLKLARLIKLSRVAGRLRDFVQLSPSAERLGKLLLMMSIFCHWNACAFHAAMLASEGRDGFGNWCADFFPLQPAPSTTMPPDSTSSSSSSSSSSLSSSSSAVLCSTRVDIHDRYIAAVYWAFTTFTTVGYGDIKPSMYSTYELALVIMLVVINSTAYGYIISAVVTLIKNLDPSDREYRLRMTEMKDYLRDSSANTRVGKNIKAHYQHILTSTSLFPEEKLFDKMSPSLRFDLARLVAGETLFAIPLITVMEDSFKGFVSYALFLMKPLLILRSETVCRSGGPGIEMFFLVEGECELTNSGTGEARVVGQNAVFEQYSLMARPGEIYRTVSTAVAISKKCVLYSLAIQDFRVLEDVSPAVSTYFLSQLAAVLVEDDLFTLSPTQKENVECALRNGRAFRAVAEQHEKARLSNVGNVAIAKLAVPKRRGSEWAPDLLPRLLNRIDTTGSAHAPDHARAVDGGSIVHPNGVPECP